MADISAKMIKELREMTGAGMMDCKKALVEANGDMDGAVEVLRKSGAAKMEKKASRIAAEGICRVAIDGGNAVVAEVNSETDFVAKTPVFQEFVQTVADTALASGMAGGANGEDVQPLMDGGLTELFAEKTLKIGEKLSFRRFERISGDCVASYIHAGGKIGVLVAADGANDDAVKEALENVAMQIAAMNPTFISKADVSADVMAKEREITVQSALNDPATLPKPIQASLIDKAISTKAWTDADVEVYEEQKNNKYLFNFLSDSAKAALASLAMADRESIEANKIFGGLVEGRLAKHFKEVTLLDQAYVKAEDGKQTVGAYLATVNKNIVITKMVRFEVGEGMEKRSEDFAAEVAAQLGQ